MPILVRETGTVLAVQLGGASPASASAAKIIVAAVAGVRDLDLLVQRRRRSRADSTSMPSAAQLSRESGHGSGSSRRKHDDRAVLLGDVQPVGRGHADGHLWLDDDVSSFIRSATGTPAIADGLPEVAVAARLGEAVVLHAEVLVEGPHAHAGVGVDGVDAGDLVHAAGQEGLPGCAPAWRAGASAAAA